MCKKNLEIRNEKLTSKEGLTIKPITETKIMTKYQVIDLEELEILVQDGNSISDIARYFKVGRDTIRKYIKKYNLESRRESAIKNMIKSNKDKYRKMYLKLNGIKTIATYFHTSPLKVKTAIEECGLEITESGKLTKIKNHVLESDFFVSISQLLRETIIGQLLGDGCIQIQLKGSKEYIPNLSSKMYYKTRSFLRSLRDQDIDNLNDELIKKFDFAKKFIGSFPTAQFRIHVSIILIQWIQYLASLFENEGYKCNLFIKDKTKPTKYFDETTGFDTSSSVQLYEIYSEWYPKNKKILPENLIITPNILLHWYIGDGSFSKNALYLSTLNFTESEVEKLTKILFRDVGIKCKPRKVRDGFEIYISMEKENLARFFNYLEKANASTLQIAKRVFGWKFDRNLSYESFLEINHLI